MAEEIGFENGRNSNFKGSWPWPWPWIRPYGIPSCITHRPLPTYQTSLRSEWNFFRRSPLRFWSSSESRDTKTRTNIKNPARSIYILCSSLRISGHLPAPIVNGGGDSQDRFWKWKEFKFQGLVTLTLTLDGIPSCITHRPLPTYQISLRSEEKIFS